MTRAKSSIVEGLESRVSRSLVGRAGIGAHENGGTEAAGGHAYLAIHALNACNHSSQAHTLTSGIAPVPTSIERITRSDPSRAITFKLFNLPPTFFPCLLTCSILLLHLFSSRALILPGLRRLHSLIFAYPCGLGSRAGGGPVEILEDGIDGNEQSRQRAVGREGEGGKEEEWHVEAGETIHGQEAAV